ncbi:SUMO1 sentrin specific peptidase 8 [Homalodisca vitripennis]|nr:SUMO1 sentrin specific peptidase 8 [Homalodisca vitripennis]
MLQNIHVDSCTETNIIELASILNSFSVNNPDVDINCVVGSISELLKSMSTLYENYNNLIQKNDELYCENLRLVSFVESFKRDKQTQLNDSFQLQDSIVEQNEVLSCKLQSVEAKVSNLKSQLLKSREENSVLKSCSNVNHIDLPDKNVVLKLQQKVSAYQENIHTLISKLDQVVGENSEYCKINSELLSQLEDVKLQNTPSGCSVTNNYWFDDSILQAYFSSFNDHPTTVSSKTLFIDPSVSEFIKIGCKDDVIKQLQELKFESYKYVFCGVSNSKGSMSSCRNTVDKHDEGSHWSLLFCDVSNRVAYHLDSAGNLNVKYASKIANRLGFSLESVACFKQNNGFECGLNVLINAKLISQYFCPNPNNRQNFLKWFEKCTPCASSNKVKVKSTEQFTNEISNSSTVSENHVSISTREKLSLKLKKVDSSTWQVVKGNRGNTQKFLNTTPVELEISNRFSNLTDLTPESLPDTTKDLPVNQESGNSLKPTSQSSTARKKVKISNRKNQKKSWVKNSFVVTNVENTKHDSPITNVCPKVAPVNVQSFKQTKIRFLADSHGRGLSGLFLSNCPPNYDFCVDFKPNGTLKHVIKDYKTVVKPMCSNDTLIVFAGTNDIVNNGHCEQDIVGELEGLLMNTTALKVIIVALPLRFDKPSLNGIIKTINDELVSLASRFEHCTFLALDLLADRRFYTSHGLHLNYSGKRKIVSQLSSLIFPTVLNTPQQIPVLVSNRNIEIQTFKWNSQACQTSALRHVNLESKHNEKNSSIFLEIGDRLIKQP